MQLMPFLSLTISLIWPAEVLLSSSMCVPLMLTFDLWWMLTYIYLLDDGADGIPQYDGDEDNIEGDCSLFVILHITLLVILLHTNSNFIDHLWQGVEVPWNWGANMGHGLQRINRSRCVLMDKRCIPLRSSSVWTPHLFHHGIPKVLVNPRSKGITSVRSNSKH
jgi:hypothetical protein